MKKALLSLFSFLLVLGLLGTSFGSVKAEIGDDPVVTPVSGDMEFTTEVISIASLPGTTELESLMLVPVGFPLGEAQYEGNGVHVMDLDGGKASACFAVSGMKYGWGGKVGLWNGTKWVLLPTTITKGEEDLNSLACATVSGHGIYAFIKYVTDPSLLNQCELVTEGWYLGTDDEEGDRYFYVSLDGQPDGTPATLTFVSAVPGENYYGFDGVDNALVGNFISTDADFFDSDFGTEGPVLVTVRVTAGGCSATLQLDLNSNPS